MNTLTNAQKRALHRVIEMAEAWVRASKASDASVVEAWVSTVDTAKSAMQQVHIQQVYLKKQNNVSEAVQNVAVASGG